MASRAFQVHHFTERAKIIKIKRDIDGLSSKDRSEVVETIGTIHARISTLKDSKEKEKVATKMRGKARLGLDEELDQLLEENTLGRERLNLVLNYLTDIPSLAKYLYTNANNPRFLGENGLTTVAKELVPKLQVFGGLVANGIDISRPWVKRLRRKASSVVTLARLTCDELEECCQEANESEIDELFQMVEYAVPNQVNFYYLRFHGSKTPVKIFMIYQRFQMVKHTALNKVNFITSDSISVKPQ